MRDEESIPAALQQNDEQETHKRFNNQGFCCKGKPLIKSRVLACDRRAYLFSSNKPASSHNYRGVLLISNAKFRVGPLFQ